MPSSPADSSLVTFHATTVAYHGMAVMLTGPSGSGKSDLALRLLDRNGWRLVADDRTLVSTKEGRAFVSCPPQLSGKIEVRGLGIIDLAQTRVASEVELAGVVELVGDPGDVPRMPDAATANHADTELPMIRLYAPEQSAPLKVELFLQGVAKVDLS